ncbi:hypothetical protein MKX03_013018, partial [Papaver bracteatum]
MCRRPIYSIVVVFPEYSRSMANTEVPKMLKLMLRTCAEVLVHLMEILSHTSEVPCKEDDGGQHAHAIAGNKDSFFGLVTLQQHQIVEAG